MTSCTHCDAPAHSCGLCHAHYERQRLGRSMTAPLPRTLEERFWAKVTRNDGGCWTWIGAKGGSGRYGMFAGTGGRARPAHRWSYEYFVGPIPEGLELDHLCRNTLCVNPEHLEPVTHAENVRRGDAGKPMSSRTHCKNGHPFDHANTHRAFTASGQPYRSCRACGRQATRDFRARRATSASLDLEVAS